MSARAFVEPPDQAIAEPVPASAAGHATDDDALILWMLGLDATQRLQAAQGFVDSVEALRRARRG